MISFETKHETHPSYNPDLYSIPSLFLLLCDMEECNASFCRAVAFPNACNIPRVLKNPGNERNEGICPFRLPLNLKLCRQCQSPFLWDLATILLPNLVLFLFSKSQVVKHISHAHIVLTYWRCSTFSYISCDVYLATLKAYIRYKEFAFLSSSFWELLSQITSESRYKLLKTKLR